MLLFTSLKIFAILKYCYKNYASNTYVKEFIERMTAALEETNILQESMEEEVAEIVSSLDEKDEEESEEQKEEERISYPCPLLMRVTLQLIHCLISLRTYRRMNAIMNAMMIAMIPWIHLKYPFLMNLMLSMLVAMMPI